MIAYIHNADNELLKIVHIPSDDNGDCIIAICEMERFKPVRYCLDIDVYYVTNSNKEELTVELTYIDGYTTLYSDK